jgi:hypothetical protein
VPSFKCPLQGKRLSAAICGQGGNVLEHSSKMLHGAGALLFSKTSQKCRNPHSHKLIFLPCERQRGKKVVKKIVDFSLGSLSLHFCLPGLQPTLETGLGAQVQQMRQATCTVVLHNGGGHDPEIPLRCSESSCQNDHSQTAGISRATLAPGPPFPP